MTHPPQPDPDAPSEDEAEPYQHVEAVLRQAGRPLTRSDLRAALNLEAADSELFHGLVGREPFIEVDARRWGLIDRDVPAGEIGFRQALKAIHEADSKDAESAFMTVCKLSVLHATWTYEMAASAYRVHKSRALAMPRAPSGIRIR